MDNSGFNQYPYDPKGQQYAPPPYGGQPQYGQPQYAQPQATQFASQQSSNVTVVNAGGMQPSYVVQSLPERDWTIAAVMATLFCFFPTGICAIIAAVNAKSQFMAGDIEGGRSSNAWARGLTISSVVIGSILITLIIVLYVYVWSVVSNVYNT